MLTDSRATGLATSHDFTVTVDELFQQLEVFVIDVHGPRSLAIYVQRILTRCTRFSVFLLTTATAAFWFEFTQWISLL